MYLLNEVLSQHELRYWVRLRVKALTRPFVVIHPPVLALKSYSSTFTATKADTKLQASLFMPYFDAAHPLLLPTARRPVDGPAV